MRDATRFRLIRLLLARYRSPTSENTGIFYKVPFIFGLRCVATNKYATVVDGKEQEYELKLEQALTISCNCI